MAATTPGHGRTIEEFDVDKATTCGHPEYYAKGQCRACYNRSWAALNRERRSEYKRQWREANLERHQEMQRAWREANADRKAAYARAWSEANPERVAAARERWRSSPAAREGLRAWRAANPEKVAAQFNRRRARMKGAVNTLTDEQWLDILDEFDHRCAYCNVGGVPLEMEHMTPLARGGRHTASNVVPACGPCNREKSTKTALEFVGPRRVNA